MVSCVVKNCIVALPVVLAGVLNTLEARAISADISPHHARQSGVRLSAEAIACSSAIDRLHCLTSIALEAPSQRSGLTAAAIARGQLFAQATAIPDNPFERSPLPGTNLTVPTREDSPPDLPLSPADPPDSTPTLSPEQPAEALDVEPNAGDTVVVKKIVVEGNTVLQEDIEQLVRELEGQQFERDAEGGIPDIYNGITKLYLDEGYITSRALQQGPIAPDGTVTIQVIEGQVVAIEIANEEDLQLIPAYIRSRIALGTGTPLNVAKLEDRLRLLRADPLIDNIEASLMATGELGKSILSVLVIEANPFSASLSSDNYSPPSIGGERFDLSLRYGNWTGLGDEVALTYEPSVTGGAHLLRGTYRVPLNPMNGTLQFRVEPYWTSVTQSPFDDFDIDGIRQDYGILYRQPLIRTFTEELALSVGFSFTESQTFVLDRGTPFGFGPEDNGISRTSVFNFDQDYVRRDPVGAWFTRSRFKFGTGLFDATSNDSSIPDGHFFSWLFQAQRVQVLNDSNLLILQADLQVTPDPLLSSQQFTIGGGQSVRGYRQNVRSADNGFRLSIEDRITLLRDGTGAPKFQLAPFVDMGQVWNVGDNPNPEFDQNFLIGAGMGILWEPLKDLRLRLDYGYPFIDLDDRGDNIQDDGIYFSVNYQL